MSDVPFRSAESEAVGQLALQRIPVLLLLLVRQLENGVVVLLKLLVLLHNRRIVAPFGGSLSTATAVAASTSVLTLKISQSLPIGTLMNKCAAHPEAFSAHCCAWYRILARAVMRWKFSRAQRERKHQWELLQSPRYGLHLSALEWDLSGKPPQVQGSSYPIPNFKSIGNQPESRRPGQDSALQCQLSFYKEKLGCYIEPLNP